MCSEKASEWYIKRPHLLSNLQKKCSETGNELVLCLTCRTFAGEGCDWRCFTHEVDNDPVGAMPLWLIIGWFAIVGAICTFIWLIT